MANNEFNPFDISGLTGEVKQPDVAPTLAVAAGMNPANEAKLKELSVKSGFDVEVLRGLKPEELRPIENSPETFIESNSMRQYFADPNRAAISYADAGNLAKAEEKWHTFRRDRDVVFQNPRREQEQVFAERVVHAPMAGAKTSMITTEEASPWGLNAMTKALRGEPITSEEESQAADIQKRMEDLSGEKASMGFVERWASEGGYFGAMMAALGVRTVPKGLALGTAATAGMIFAEGMNPISLSPQSLAAHWAVGGAAGMNAARYQAIYNMEAGSAFFELHRETDEFGNKIDPKVAALAAGAVGVVNAGLEVQGLKILGKFIPGEMGKYFRVLTGEELTAGAKMALKDPVFRKRALEILGDLGKGAAGESVTEMMQDLPQMIFGYAAKVHENKYGKAFKLPEGTVGLDDNSVINLRQLAETGYSTFLGVTALGGLSTAHHLARIGKEMETAQKLGKAFDETRKALQENTTAPASPAAIKDFVNLLTDNSPEEHKTLFVDGQEAFELFQTDRKAFDTLGITEAQINEAAAAGDSLEVKTADVLGKMIGPEFNQTFSSFSKILKMAPGSMSMNEADRLQTPEAAKRVVELFATAQKFASLEEPIRAFNEQVQAAKYTPEEAERITSTFDRFVHGLLLNGADTEHVKQVITDFKIQRLNKNGIAVDFRRAPFTVEVGPTARETTVDMGTPTEETIKSSVERSPILSAIKRAGGVITSKKKAKTKGGEYDDARDIAEAFKKHIRGNKKVDELARDLHRQGILADDSPTTFWTAVKAELDSIKGTKEEASALAARQERLDEWVKTQSEPVGVNDLRVGDTFQVQGKTYTVAEETDQALRVTSEDGYDAMYPFEESNIVRIDKGTLLRSGASVELNQMQQAFADRIVAKITADTTKVENSETISPTDEVVGPGKEYFQVHGLEQWRKDLRNWMKRQTEFDGKTKRFTDEEIEQQLAGIEAQFKIFSALGPIELEAFPHTEGKRSKKWGPFRKNQDEIYKISFDASAMCVKRLEMAATMAYIEEQLSSRTGGTRNALTAAERTALACLFKLAGKSAPCLYCYVEGPRGREGSFVEQGMEVLFREGEPGSDWSKNLLRRVAEALDVIERNKIKAEDIDIGSLLDPMRRDTEETKALHEGKLAPIYKFLRTLRGAAKAKKAQTYSEYESNVLNIPQELLNELNGYAGLRFFSSSDFQAEHVVDLMQVFVDTEVRKAKAHSYTKVPMFAEIFGATGMKINLSIFGKWVDGKPVMDAWQGMDWEEAKRLRKEHPNVGTVLVATSPEMIEWGLNTDWVDYIIPYHFASGFESKYYTELDWQNFSGTQKEMWRLTEAQKLAEKEERAAAKKAGRKWVNPCGKFPPQIRMWQLGLDKGRGDMSLAEYNRRASKRYLDLCEEKGYEPVFERVTMSNGESVTTHPNYIKLKKDYARTDTAFQPVKADFSGKKAQAAIKKALNMTVEAGGNKATPDKKIARELLNMIKNAKPGEDIGIKMLRQLGLNKTFNQTRNLGFYSPVETAVLKMDFKNISGKDLLNRIEKAPGIKKEELDDIGLKDWLVGLGDTKVSREQVEKFIQDRGPQLFETVKQDKPAELLWADPFMSSVGRTWASSIGRKTFVITQLTSNGKFILDLGTGMTEVHDSFESANSAAQRVAQNYKASGGTKFESWTLKGGGNYREGLIRIPERAVPEVNIAEELKRFREELRAKYGEDFKQKSTPEEYTKYQTLVRSSLSETSEAQAEWEKRNYRFTGHFVEPNIVAHFRLKDFIGADGKKVLHIEEIQSDWHQNRQKALKAREKLDKIVEDIRAKSPDLNPEAKPGSILMDKAAKALGVYDEYSKAERSVRENALPPDAPFKKSWAALAFKRILRLAAEGGYDRVSWTTGDQQTIRYNEALADVAKIEYVDGILLGYDIRGQEIFSEAVEEDKLGNWIGEDKAEKLLEMNRQFDPTARERALEWERSQWSVQQEEEGGPEPRGWNVVDPNGEIAYDFGGHPHVFTTEEAANRWIDLNPMRELREERQDEYPSLTGDDLKISNSGMVKFYDERLVIIANDILKKYKMKTGKTVIGKEGTTLEGQDIVYTEPYTVHSLELTEPMKEDILAGQTLYQPGKKMGSVTVTDTSYLIKLFDGAADESTLLHELGHVFLLETQNLIASGKASSQALKDWAAITEWLELKPGQSFDTSHHEKFAAGFEAYLREGRAPSIELESAFEMFKAWLRKVYTTVQDLWTRADQEIRLTPAIRGVFDRMLATDLEVEAAATRNGLLIPESDLDRLGVKPADKAFIKQLLDQAREKGKAKYDKIRARREAEKNAPWIEEATAKLEAERAFRTIGRIRAEGLNTALVEEIVGPGATEIMAQFRKRIPAGLRKEGGLDPNQLAAEMGYDSGSDMLGEIYSFPTKEEYIKAYVEQKKIEAGEEAPTAEETLLEGAEAEEYIATIGRQILKKVNPTKMVRSQDAHIHQRIVARTAEQKINEMSLKDAIRVDRFLAAFRTASVKCRDAMGRDDWQSALTFNSQARLQLELVKLSREIRDRLEDQVDRVKKTLRSSGKIDPDYHYNFINTAFRFGLAPRQLPYDNTRQTLAALLAPDEDAGLEMPPVFSNDLLDERNSKSYKELDVATAMELFDLLKYLEVTGRRVVSGELLTQEGTRDEKAAVLITGMPNTKATVRPKNSFLRMISDWAGDYLATCKVLQFIFRAADGLEKMGAHTTMLWNEIQKGYNTKINRRDAVLAMIQPSLEYFAQRKKSWDASSISVAVPELLKKDGRSWTWENILGIALNRGNTYNLNAVMNGYQLSRTDIDALTASLSSEDWAHVQMIWDAVESLWPDLKKTYEDVAVVAPKKVSADPFTVTTSDGVYRLVRGGYFPVSFDSQLALRVEEWSEKDNLLNSFTAAFPKPNVPNGYMKERKGTGGLPVQLDYRFTLLKHLDFATTYIGLARILKDVDAITRSKLYTGAFVDRFGVQTYKQIRPVLAYIARGSLRSFDSIEKFIRNVGQMGTAAAMFGRASTVLKQFFDRGTLASEIGELNFQRGNLTMLQNPIRGIKFIEESSPMMRERFRQKYAGLNEAIMQPFAESTVGEKGIIGAQEILGLPFRLFDIANTSAGWMGAYQAHLAETLDHDAAVHYADNAIAAAAPSSRAMDLSAFQRDGSAFKILFAPFNSWRLKFQNRLVSTVKGVMDGQVSVMDAARASFFEIFYPVVGWFLMRTAIQSFPGAPEPPEEKDINDVLLDVFRTIFGALPIVGDIVQGVAQKLGGFRSVGGPFEPPALKAGEDVVKALADVAAPTQEEEEYLAIKRRLWGIAGAASVVLRIPATRLYVDLLEGMRQYEETGRPGLILLPDSDLRRR